MSRNVLLTAGALKNPAVGEAAKAILDEAGCEITVALNAGITDAGELRRALAGMDAVLAGVEPYTKELLADAATSELKVISRWGVGFDAVDLNAATERGIIVANTPGLLNNAVADYAFGLLLALARRLHEGHLGMRAGEWAPSWGVDVSGATLGIVGLGRIGKVVAKRASGFGMKILACDPKDQPEAEALGAEMVGMERLLAESDFVSLHTALNDGTRGLIGEAELKAMREDALLINTSRGAVVDEAALVRALHEGWIGGAALDTYCVEPMAPDYPLRTAPNVLLMPHQASFGVRTGRSVSKMAAQAIVDAMNGKRPESVVNAEVLGKGTRAGV